MSGSLPSVMRAWQYSNTKGGLEKNLRLNESAPVPQPSSNQHLVQILATALNPVDFKPAEIRLLSHFAIPKPATPGIDFAGTLITPAAGSSLKPGQLVFGASGTSHLAGGSLAEYAVAKEDQVVAIPEGVDPISASTVCVAGLTAHQSIVPYVKAGDKIFINGGSGGTGVFGIQIAKAVGCHVTTTCSSVNVDLCKSLGADAVIDYRTQNVVDALKASGHKFDHVVDNIGANSQLYWKCHEYTRPGALFMVVGAQINRAFILDMLLRKLWPGFLGGGKRQSVGFFPKPKPSDLEQIATWMKEGRVKAVVDEKFPFERAPQAIEKLKTGRAKGKVVVEVASNGSN
ncbi:Zinc-type alcohol dehydrogenase-like protein [Fonsecaea pedrosoi]|nr:Zinc-type alcohol dehydrogenase-like protein [Fonsecaea pedrosoi]